ncbi:MAG: thioredoxin domain-containing protein [Myxococcales bacterium]|nr:thioredoxin domain-containing protein [Myxococcales bacterium]
MRALAIVLVMAACSSPPARDAGDAARVAALEQRVALLEAQLRSMSAKLRLLEDEHDELATSRKDAVDPAAPINAGPAPLQPPPPGQPGIRWQTPDPSKTYRVPIDDSPVIGPSPAPITIVASLQFPEPYTHKVMPTLLQLRRDHPREVRLVVKLFIVHPRMTASSIASCAVAYQDALEAMEIAVWDAAQDQSLAPQPGGGMRSLDEVELRELARALRVDLKQYDQDLATCKAGLARDQPVLAKLGQSGVPAFWINGRYLSGAQPIETFRKLIDEELDRYRADKTRGGKLATYYDRLMKGAPTGP